MTDIETKALALVEKLRALHVWPQAVADDHADLLTPRQIEKLYEVGRVSHEAADLIETQAREIERLKAEVMRQMQWKTEAQNDVDEMATALDNIANESSDTWAREKARAALGARHDQ